MKKAILAILAIVITGITGSAIYLYTAYPDVPPAPALSVEGTDGQIERGQYLAENVVLCMDCHSKRDWSKFSGPITPGTYGMGGDLFNQDMGFPGTFYAKNITPHNLKDWTDGEIYRAITTGVSRDGTPLFPVMPYLSYGKMDPEDVKAIIAYIRTLEPVAYEPPESSADFPMNFIIRTIPKPANPQQRPDPSDRVSYGKYLTTIAACTDCHTPQKQGKAIEGMLLAGGFEMKMPFGTIWSANITPHKKTGIGNWSKEQFVNKFKQYDLPTDSLLKVAPEDFNSIMPWQMYAGMKKEDLEAIYTYLRTIPAVDNRVTKFTPATTVTPK